MIDGQGRLARFWLSVLFWHAWHAPFVARWCRPLVTRIVFRVSRDVREAGRANAMALLATPDEARKRAHVQAVVGSFYDAILEMASRRRTDVRSVRPSRLEGAEAYRVLRSEGGGAILVTAHLGSFETAIALLRDQETRVHVVFHRDVDPRFEALRSNQRARLGVTEAPVEDGLRTWMSLRDALLANEVVLMQADRVLPGQRGTSVPFLGGSMAMPDGPVRLSRLTGAPIVPVFTPRSRDGVEVLIRPAIRPEAHPVAPRGKIDPMLLAIADEIERVVTHYPEQWLCLHRILN